MKKIIALLLILICVFAAGCGAGQTAPAEPTPEPTPEVTEDPHHIPMSGFLTDMLSSEYRDFLAGAKKSPPVMAVITLKDQPAAVVLDIDDVRELCDGLLDLAITAKTDISEGDTASLALIGEDGKRAVVDFSGEKLAVDGAYYELEDAGDLLALMRDAAGEASEEAAEIKATVGTEDFYKATNKNPDETYMMRVASEPAVVSAEDESSRTVEVKLAVTNTAEHLLMSAKLIARYVDAEGRVLASVPVDLDFNASPVYIYETRDYTLSQKLFKLPGESQPEVAGALIEIVSVNAPNEAGH